MISLGSGVGLSLGCGVSSDCLFDRDRARWSKSSIDLRCAWPQAISLYLSFLSQILLFFIII